MKLSIDSQIFENFPDFKVGVIVIKGFSNSKRRSDVESLLRGISAQRSREFIKKDIHHEEKIYVWEHAYQKFNIDPNKKKPSVAALLERVTEAEDIPHINALVDLYNYFSLKYLLPIGSEDLDWLCGDLKLTVTHGGEAFRPIGSIDVKTAKANEIAYMDDGGITCRYWNYRECERTKLTEKTVNAAILVEDLSKMHMDEFGMVMKDIQNSIIKYIGGQISPYVLNEENQEIELGVQGRIRMDDAKVTAQEKAYYLKKQERDEAVEKSVDETVVANVEAGGEGGIGEVEETFKRQENKVSESVIYEEVEEETDKLVPDTLEINTDELIKKKISRVLSEALQKSFESGGEIDIKIEYPEVADHGDYAANVAMQLSKELGMPPRDIAAKIVENVDKGDFIEKVEVAGPGFINFFLSKGSLKQEVKKIVLDKDEYGCINAGKEKIVVVDYSQPNIAKPLGVHHLLSTVIGQSICNIFRSLKYKVEGVNYIGDWGTQFGKLIFAYKNWGNREQIEQDPIAELLKLYIKFHDESEQNPKIEDQARHEFKIFEDGDAQNHELWQWIVDVSLIDVQKTYDKLGGIKFDHVKGEAFISDRLPDILEEGKKLGIFEIGEEGSYIIRFKDPNMPPYLVQKKDGATLYSTRDVATLKYRIETYDPVKILYVVDRAQSLHFKQLFLGSSRFPWFKNVGEHVMFGRMNMKDKSMSTRKGNIVLLNEVLEEAVERAKKVIMEKSPHLENIDAVAEAVGIGSIKYNVLSQNRETDMTFDWDRMLSFDGNSSPYLQYSYARGKSILRKAEEDDAESVTIADNEETEKKIMSLIRLFPKYSEILVDAAKEYKPNILCNYLYKLAQEFNSFYNSVSVLRAESEEDKKFRLEVVEATSWILRNGLGLLGVNVVEEM
ncbi:arginine--tRNA ligase [Patescibacteria group bacterium]